MSRVALTAVLTLLPFIKSTKKAQNTIVERGDQRNSVTSEIEACSCPGGSVVSQTR
jgi:hypothetical protein